MIAVMSYLHGRAFRALELQGSMYYIEPLPYNFVDITDQRLCLLDVYPVNKNMGAHGMDIGAYTPDMDIMHALYPIDHHDLPG